ncbi:MAG: class I SAM-dependent methyltransferase [Gammaproteobacteria bacterium]
MTWDTRYSSDDYVYGTEPNEFLRSVADQLPVGRSLCIGEGEGRNGTFLATLGHDVTALDASSVGLAKAVKLAASRGARIDTIHTDLADYAFEPDAWHNIVSIFCHTPPALRRLVHSRAVGSLKPGGMFVLEAYRPRQLEYGTGGPPVAELMMTLPELREELTGLEIVHGAELDREVHEGRLHTGRAAVVQVLALKR